MSSTPDLALARVAAMGDLAASGGLAELGLVALEGLAACRIDPMTLAFNTIVGIGHAIRRAASTLLLLIKVGPRAAT